jgi:hypothetical protein
MTNTIAKVGAIVTKNIGATPATMIIMYIIRAGIRFAAKVQICGSVASPRMKPEQKSVGRMTPAVCGSL